MSTLYDHKQEQARVQQMWQQEGIYKTPRNKKELYSIDTPPPTVSGALHIGHIFSYTQTDIIARYKRLNGFSVFYPFGFDDNGLPTERFVEKKLQISSYALGRSAFIKVCLQETKEVEEQFKHLWQQMGLSVDWDACYSTISDATRKLSQESFIDLYKKGYIYRAYEPALYCTVCRTSVAQAELDDVQKPSFFNDIVFQDHQGKDLIIGTTRPELLPACVALMYHPDDYRYQYLKGTQATVPLYDFTVPVIADEAVDMQKGTGLVMCCTFGDKTDIAWYKKYKLPYKQVIGFDGKWVESTGPLVGLKAQAARIKIIELLKEKNLLLRQQAITHAVNTHERCKNEIEYVALSQWFLSILPYKKEFIALADQIQWYPAFMKARYKNWVENISWDWCLSRQRFFGIPFPAWHCKECNTVILSQEHELPLDPQETPYNKPCPTCKSTNAAPDTDVMDTWNTSSITPYICQQLFDGSTANPFTEPQTEFIPMGMRPQAHDIIRTWAFYTIVKTWMHHKDTPWQNIVISGHVLSDAKEKISKSKDNNKLAPENLLQTYPADVIRYWTASGSLGQDVAFSENQLKIGQRLITKLWNAFRFIQEHTSTIDAHEFDAQEVGLCNQWLLHEATVCFEQYQFYFSSYEFGLALDAVEKFFWNVFCDNYIELIKHQLFHPEHYKKEELASTKLIMHQVGLRLLQLYAPYLPHITETLYGTMYKPIMKTPSLHITDFEDVQIPYTFGDSQTAMAYVNEVIGTVRKLKTEKQLSLKTPLATLTCVAPHINIIEILQSQQQLLKGVCQAATIEFKVDKTGGQSALMETGGTLRGLIRLEV